MEKSVGKLYVSAHSERRNGVLMDFELVIFCTGEGSNERHFSGVVVRQTDEWSSLPVGMHSDSWTWNEKVFTEYKGDFVLNNEDWKSAKYTGDCSNG